MQNDSIEYIVSWGYPKGMEMILNIVSSRNDVQIYNKTVDSTWGCGDVSIRGSWDSYRALLTASRDMEDPECFFSIEHFQDSLI